MHSLVCQLQHMHQNIPQHAFTPVLHQSSTILPTPTPMGPQDRNFNTNLPGQTVRTFFAPIRASHKATQRIFNSRIRGRWGALHVCIAWKIYYHKQLKKMRQMHSSQQELTPECPATSLSTSIQQKELNQPCTYPYLDSSSGSSACGSKSESGKTVANTGRNASSLSDLHTPSPVPSRSCANEREKPDCEEQDQHSTPDEKEKHQICQSSPTNDSPHKDEFMELKVTADLDGRRCSSLSRKRQLECEGINKAKRMKQETLESQFGFSQTLHYDPPPFITTRTHLLSHNTQMQHTNISDLSFLYPNSIRFNVSYPGTKLHPCQTASWETMRNIHALHFRKYALKDYSQNTCKAIRKPLAARGFTPPPYFLQGREILTSREVPTPLQMSAASHRLSTNAVLGP